MKTGKVIAVTMGDAGGIGPEIILKALYQRRWPAGTCFVIIGSRTIIRRQSKLLGVPEPLPWRPLDDAALPSRVVIWEPGAADTAGSGFRFQTIRLEWSPGRTGPVQGRAAAQWIRAGVQGCLSRRFDGMVTGPICKKSFQQARIPFPGHTEYLAALTGTPSYAMMLIGGPLRVVLVTRHIPLAGVPAAVTRASIIEATRLAARALAWLGLEGRPIGVCALNPHAGDEGAIGREDKDVVAPAVRALRRECIAVTGPVPGDVIFHDAYRRRYGAVVAMYHDQGLGPLKMIAFEKGVNLTLGLPLVRTSPDHGTAFNIAGKGLANPGSMVEAVRMAIRLAHRPNPWRVRP